MIIFKQIYLTYRWDPNWHNHQPFQVRVNLEVMAMKEYSTLIV